MFMDAAFPEVYDPWWDIWDKDDYTDTLEWTPVRSDISEEKDNN